MTHNDTADNTPHRVVYKETGEEGTIMNTENGERHILWDAHKGSKLPYFSYPVNDPTIGTIH